MISNAFGYVFVCQMSRTHTSTRDTPAGGTDCTVNESDIDRRTALRTAGIALVGSSLGIPTMTDRTRATTTATEFDHTTWQSDAVPDRPVRERGFPGPHHAAMVDPDPADR